MTVALLALAVALLGGGLVARGIAGRRVRNELERVTTALRDAAVNDDVTGLGNKVRLMEDLNGHIARGRRYGNGFAVVLFELEGDVDTSTLVIAATIVASTARGADRCYRVGNLIVSVLPEQGVPGAMVAAERARAGLKFASSPSTSIGVAAWVPWEDEKPEDVLRRVASLARTSARNGGDRITVAEPSRA